MWAKYFLKMGVTGKTLIWKHILSKFLIHITIKPSNIRKKVSQKRYRKLVDKLYPLPICIYLKHV